VKVGVGQVSAYEAGNQVGAMAANVEAVRERIVAACIRGRRDISEVKLIAVSKNVPSSRVRVAVNCGLHDFGENRVQEAYSKFHELADIRSSIWLHFLGHLQTNKVKEALEISDMIHSIDSVRLAEAINERSDRKISCLLEVNVAGEKTKFGFSADELEAAVRRIEGLTNIDLVGLMTVAPVADDPEDVRPVFAQLRKMSEIYGLKELSMGMTDDFEVAIEEGATMVRIGRAIFGQRS
jgi:PLP dependent protein